VRGLAALITFLANLLIRFSPYVGLAAQCIHGGLC
jgi:hypothetical protein